MTCYRSFCVGKFEMKNPLLNYSSQDMRKWNSHYRRSFADTYLTLFFGKVQYRPSTLCRRNIFKLKNFPNSLCSVAGMINVVNMRNETPLCSHVPMPTFGMDNSHGKRICVDGAWKAMLLVLHIHVLNETVSVT